MLGSDAHDALGAARDRVRRLHDDAAAERLRGGSGTRHALADLLREAAEPRDPAPLAPLRAVRDS